MRFLVFALGILATGIATAQPFPSRPVRMIVPYPTGGTADAIPRLIVERLSARWGQPVIIENRTGAGGNIGAEAVARAEPDGYTLLASAPGPLTVNDLLYRKLSYDPTRFLPVSILASMPNVLAVRPDLPARNVGELVALARSKPGEITYASQGNGTTSHLTASLLQSMAGIELVHIPYKGTAPALLDLMGGRVDLMFDNITSSLAPARAGRIKILAVATAQRLASLPNVPTLHEAGFTGFESGTWVGVAAPAGTPDIIVGQLGVAMAEAVRQPEVQHKMTELGAAPIGNLPSEAAAFIAAERSRWRRVIEAANVTLD